MDHLAQDIIECDLWAFENIPSHVIRWAWLSCGLIGPEMMMSFYPGMTTEQLQNDMEFGRRAFEELVPCLTDKPILVGSAGDMPSPQAGEKIHVWLIQAPDSDNDNPVWNKMPAYITPAIDREMMSYYHLISQLEVDRGSNFHLVIYIFFPDDPPKKK